MKNTVIYTLSAQKNSLKKSTHFDKLFRWVPQAKADSRWRSERHRRNFHIYIVQHLHQPQKVAKRMAGWWLFPNPFEKYDILKLDHFPNDRGENKKYLSCHHLDEKPETEFWDSIFWGRTNTTYIRFFSKKNGKGFHLKNVVPVQAVSKWRLLKCSPFKNSVLMFIIWLSHLPKKKQYHNDNQWPP